MEEKIELKLTVEEVNTILKFLCEGPYKEVSDVVIKIVKQGEDQIAKAKKLAAENVKPTK